MSKKRLRHTSGNDAFSDTEQVVSATECTGLMPAQIETGEQGEQLASLQNIPPIRPMEKK